MSHQQATTILPARFNSMDRIARGALLKHLSRLHNGQITLQDTSGCASFGSEGDLKATLHVCRPRFFRNAVLGGTLSVAESYLQGDWECDDLVSLFRIFARNRDCATGLDRSFARLAGVGHHLFHWWHSNTREGSRRNIGAHYDLGNDFFRLWLDDTMAYSCGIFRTKEASLTEASLEKFDTICRTLNLRPSDEVIEVGTGWGGFAVHAATNYGCHVTTTTISREQYEGAEQRIEHAGLASQITLLQKDYRDLRGQFDKMVSIEMIEAVGHRFLDDYFRQCSRLLRPHGTMLLQAIVMPERGYEQYLGSVDFIQRYVFPGGCLPSLGSILASVARVTDMRFLRAEDLSPHYAETLRRWRTAFHAQLHEVRALGYSEQFIKLWNYYLSYCEAAFEERCIGVLQILLEKPEYRRQIGDRDEESCTRACPRQDTNSLERMHTSHLCAR
jgi:cyclopropane-fatty-acyl-phospholipid synthase